MNPLNSPEKQPDHLDRGKIAKILAGMILSSQLFQPGGKHNKGYKFLCRKEGEASDKKTISDLLKRVTEILDKYPESFSSIDLSEVLDRILEHFPDGEKLDDFMKLPEDEQMEVLREIITHNPAK